MDKFIVPSRPRCKIERNTDGVVKISAEAYNALVEICNESTLSFREVASRAILFAAEHVEYEKEGDEQCTSTR